MSYHYDTSPPRYSMVFCAPQERPHAYGYSHHGGNYARYGAAHCPSMNAEGAVGGWPVWINDENAASKRRRATSLPAAGWRMTSAGTNPSRRYRPDIYAPYRARADPWSDVVLLPWTSKMCPEVSPALAYDTTDDLYDVRVPPHIGIESRLFRRYASAPATSRPTTHLRLISYDIAWTFDVDLHADSAYGASIAKHGHIGPTAAGRAYTSGYVRGYVTVGDVWTTLYRALGEAISDSEWALLVASWNEGDSWARGKKKKIEDAVSRGRVGVGVGERRFTRRVDWLGRCFIFQGLGRDDVFAHDVLLPGRKSCVDTFVIKFGNLKAMRSNMGLSAGCHGCAY